MINVVSTSGTVIWVHETPPPSTLPCYKLKDYVTTGQPVVCLQSISGLSRNRNVTTYTCMSSGEQYASAGASEIANFTIDMLYDSHDIRGQELLIKAYNANTPVWLGLELSDGTLFTFSAIITSEKMGVGKQGAVTLSMNATPTSEVFECEGDVPPPQFNNHSVRLKIRSNDEPIVKGATDGAYTNYKTLDTLDNNDGTWYVYSEAPIYKLELLELRLQDPIEIIFEITTSLTSMNSLFFLDQKISGAVFATLESVSFTNEVDTSNVTDFYATFANLPALQTLDVTNLDTSNGTNLLGMFALIGSAVTQLDLSNINTAKATDIQSMFAGAGGLTSLDLSSFDTSNVTNMAMMFQACYALTSIDMSSFNTSNVTSMEGMFTLTNITTLDVTMFDTSKVTNMTDMFSGTQLTTIDISNFNTLSLETCRYMFNDSKFTSLDLTNFNVSNGVRIDGLFRSARDLVCITNINTEGTTEIDRLYIFTNCTSLVQPDAAAQADLTDIDGANWINANACP